MKCGTPTQPTIPPGRADRSAWSTDSSVPTHSRTASAPIPLVSSLTASTPSSPRPATMSVAPNSLASACRSACRLIAMIRSAPSWRGGEHAGQPDRAVADDHHRAARPDVGADRGVPAGAHHVGQRQDARHHRRRPARSGVASERAVGVLDPDQLGLAAVVPGDLAGSWSASRPGRPGRCCRW